MNHDFGLGLVDVVDNFSGQHYAVGGIANHNRILRVDLLQAPQVEQLANHRNDFGQLLRENGIAQIKCFYDLFFVIFALLRLIRNDENDVGSHRAPERLALQRDDIQRLLQRDVGQIHRNAPRSKVHVENHGEAGEFSDRIEDGFCVVRGLHVNRSPGQRRQLRRPRHQFGFVRTAAGHGHRRRTLRLRGSGILLRADQIDGRLDLLRRHRAGGIDHRGLAELREGQFEVRLIPEFSALVHMPLAGLKARPGDLEFIFSIVGFGLQSLVVIIQSRVVVFCGFGFVSSFVLVASFAAA